MAEEPIIFVTADKWIRENGKLDETDREILNEAAQGGKVIVMTLGQALERMKAEDPKKFDEFKAIQEKQAGRLLTIADIEDLAGRADETKTAFDALCELQMTREQAEQVRAWRLDGHYTWRAVARAAWKQAIGWQWGMLWSPPSNQIAGMSLSERAAKMLGQNYREDPWN